MIKEVRPGWSRGHTKGVVGRKGGSVTGFMKARERHLYSSQKIVAMHKESPAQPHGGIQYRKGNVGQKKQGTTESRL